MKKILALVTVLALVAALVVPMAVSAATGPAVPATPNVEITGSIATLLLPLPPRQYRYGMFVGTGWTGWSFTSTGTPGVVTVPQILTRTRPQHLPLTQ